MTPPTVPTERLDVLLRDPATTGIFTDFDGTLSEIVDDPADARPVPGVVEVLAELAEHFACVGVLSGRPLSFLEPFFSGGVLLAGLYGLEQLADGRRADHPLGGSWREVIDDVASVSRARGPEGMRVEAKGLSLTLHFRGHPDIEPEVHAWATQQALRSGLECRPARMSYELHPPIPADKGTALVGLAEGLEALCFIGDDVGDLRAFDTLDTLAATEVDTVRIAVHSSEESSELIDKADIVVDGPVGALGLLVHLRDAVAG